MKDKTGYPILSRPFLTALHHGDGYPPRLLPVGTRKARAGGKRAKRFGALLAELRRERLGKRSSYEQTARQLSTLGLATVSGSALHRYEVEGRVPDVLTVMALADLYRQPHAWLLDALAADLRGDPLPKRPNPNEPRKIPAPEGHEGSLDFVAVRLLADRIAAGPPLIIDESRTYGHLAFSRHSLQRLSVTEPLCVRVGPRERSMVPTIRPDDIVLIDCAVDRRTELKRDRIYAVNVDEGSTLKRIIELPDRLALVADNPDKEDYPTREILLAPDQSKLEVIVGEVIWWGQQL